MNLILFDLGGTLIDDPFEEVLNALYSECLESYNCLHLEKDALTEFFKYWREENLKNDYPFASHFLQEETWPLRAFMRLNRTREIPPTAEIPLLSLTALKRYRELACIQISKQPQLPLLKKIFIWLKSVGVTVGVASNDRKFATKTMLTWADLTGYLDYIFTSEELSEKYPKAEKPAPEFFHAIFNEIKRSITKWDNIIYVGDSEKNDILPARSLDLCTVRYLNKKNLQNAFWIDATVESMADFQYSDRKQLLNIFRKILKK